MREAPGLWRCLPKTHARSQDRILNAGAIAAWTPRPRLADAVETLLDAGEIPVVLGGDCTSLLGSMLALRRRGRYGLFFIDGHADFFQPEAEPNGEGASMELAFSAHARIADLKANSHSGLVIFGSSTLYNDLLAHGLVDELHPLLGNVIPGAGVRTSEPGLSGPVKLFSLRQLPGSDIIALHYDCRKH